MNPSHHGAGGRASHRGRSSSRTRHIKQLRSIVLLLSLLCIGLATWAIWAELSLKEKTHVIEALVKERDTARKRAGPTESPSSAAKTTGQKSELDIVIDNLTASLGTQSITGAEMDGLVLLAGELLSQLGHARGLDAEGLRNLLPTTGSDARDTQALISELFSKFSTEDLQLMEELLRDLTQRNPAPAPPPSPATTGAPGSPQPVGDSPSPSTSTP